MREAEHSIFVVVLGVHLDVLFVFTCVDVSNSLPKVTPEITIDVPTAEFRCFFLVCTRSQLFERLPVYCEEAAWVIVAS